MGRMSDLAIELEENSYDENDEQMERNQSMNNQIEETLAQQYNQSQLAASMLHMKQILKRVKLIREIVLVNNIENHEIRKAALNTVADYCDGIIHDYEIKENANEKS